MKALLAALMKAQQEFDNPKKDAQNPAFRSRYASLGAVQEAAFPALWKNGLLVLQSARTDVDEQGRVIVHVGAALCHVESGEQTSHELGMVPKDGTPQSVGSAITYGRRYVLMTLLGLVPDDDDGQAASQQTQRPAQVQQRPAPSQNNRPPAKPAPKDDRLPDEDFNDQSADDAPITGTMEKTLHASLGELYRGMKPAEITEKRHALVKWATNGRTESSKELTMGEAMRLSEAIGDKLRAKTAEQKSLVNAPAGNGYN